MMNQHATKWYYPAPPKREDKRDPRQTRINTLLVTVWVLMFVLCLYVQTIDAVCLDLREQVEVSGPEILVCQLAAVADAPDLLRERIGQISLGRAPWPGNVRTIDKAALQVSLRDHGISPTTVEFTGSDETAVTVKSVLIESSQLESLAREYLLELLPWPKEDLVIEAEPVRRQRVPGDAASLTLKPFSRVGVEPSSRMEVFVNTYSQSQLVKSIPVYLKVRAYERAIVASRSIARGDVLSKTSVATKRIEVLRQRQPLLDDLREVLGKVATQSIRTGLPISERMLARPRVVSRGDTVKFVMKVKSLLIIGQAVARQPGQLGDLIRVRRPGTFRDIEAVVTGLREVSVPF